MKIAIKNFQNKIPIDPKRIKRSALKVLRSEGPDKSGEITVCFVNDKKIKELNLRYFRRNASTDVLAFDITGNDEYKALVADIVISVDAAVRNSKIFKTTPKQEINLYVIHGLLHLLGYNDRTNKQRRIIRKKEKEYVDT